MSEGIVIAIIGAGAAVAAPIITGIFSLMKQNRENNSEKKIKIKQSAWGGHNTQIGIQNVCKKEDNSNE